MTTPNLPLALGLEDVGGAADQDQPVRVGADQVVLVGDILLIVAPRIGDIADRKTVSRTTVTPVATVSRPGPFASSG